jgi:hypothetical protein
MKNPLHTCNHSCNSHKAIRKPEIAKEVVSFPPVEKLF